MLWFGRPLRAFEQLSIVSFLRNGHEVHLYTYGEVEGVPEGTRVMDAAQVLPAEAVARLRSKGVPAGVVSDVFRYSLLHAHGGWWSDCDVVCLRPFDFAADVVCGWQDERVINGAVLRLPAGHVAAQRLVTLGAHPNRWMRGDPPRRVARKFRDSLLGRRGPQSMSWGAIGPAAVTTVILGSGLRHHAMSTEAFYPVSWEDSARLYASGTLDLSSATYAVHLWNEMRGGREPEVGSPIHTWMQAYGV